MCDCISVSVQNKDLTRLHLQHYGCLGGSFYLGFHKPQLDFITHYVSSGFPGQSKGERYLSSPKAVRRFFTEIDPRPTPARFCVFKPVSRFEEGETPEIVTFFAWGEVLSGLCGFPLEACGNDGRATKCHVPTVIEKLSQFLLSILILLPFFKVWAGLNPAPFNRMLKRRALRTKEN